MPVRTRQDPGPPHEALRADPVLARLLDQHGYLVLEPAPDLFERAAKAIVRQQISMDAAAATWERLVDRFTVRPVTIRDADPDALKAVGLSAAKATYLKNLARAFERQGWSRATFETMDDEAVLETLTDVAGIGPWTAKMVLQFGLGREDVFPVEDLGIRRAMETHYGEQTRAAMETRASEWAPYRSYAALYLWRSTEAD